MSDKLIDRRDLAFLLYEVFDIESLTKYPYHADHSRETFEMALDTAYALARELFWPSFQEFDRQGVRFDGKTTKAPDAMHKIWAAAKEGGWFAPSFSYEHGGQQFPISIQLATAYMFMAGNSAAAMYLGQATGAGHLLDSFGSKELQDRYMYKLYSGEWGGTMALTEPNAGTSLGDITTTATPVPGTDYYIIRGTKRFISSGDHDLTPNIIHPTLAKLPGAPPGVKGISLFVVPKYRVNDDGSIGAFNDVNTASVEHKLGLKGQATAELKFGENDECRGWLLGEANKGLTYMFQLMNEARLFTGLQAIAGASAAYQCALQYAQERVQGRPVTERDPTTPQVTIMHHPEVRRMLLRQKAAVEGVLSLLLYCSRLADTHRLAEGEEKEHAHSLLEILTPVCKAHGSDAAYESVMLGLQVFGGAGYIEEFPLAQLLRDNRVFSVYEGTNEVQAMDLLGRKVAVNAGANFRAVCEEIGKTLAQAGEFVELIDVSAKVNKAMEAVVDVTMHLGGIGMSGKHEEYISHATPYMRAFSQMIIAWQFLWQSIVAQRAIAAGNDDSFYRAKLATAKYYIDTHVPSTVMICTLIKSGEDTALNYKEEWFTAEALQAVGK